MIQKKKVERISTHEQLQRILEPFLILISQTQQYITSPAFNAPRQRIDFERIEEFDVSRPNPDFYIQDIQDALIQVRYECTGYKIQLWYAITQFKTEIINNITISPVKDREDAKELVKKYEKQASDYSDILEEKIKQFDRELNFLNSLSFIISRRPQY